MGGLSRENPCSDEKAGKKSREFFSGITLADLMKTPETENYMI